MARRKSNSQPLSLFAFQDIITGVAGVMLFILMLLVVQLALQKSQAASAPSQQPPESSEQERLQQQQQRLEELTQWVDRKKTETLANKERIKLLLDAQVQNIDNQIRVLQTSQQKLSNQFSEGRTKLDQLQSESKKAQANNPARTMMEKIEALRQELKSASNEILEWQDESRVNYKSDSTVKNLYLYDVHGSYFTMSKLAEDMQKRKFSYGSSDASSQIALKMAQEYERLPNSMKDAERRIVVLFRPSAAKHGSEVVRELRKLGFEVAMELLEAKAELFSRPSRDRSETGEQAGSTEGKSPNE
jgi:chromosome segregation ATPase